MSFRFDRAAIAAISLCGLVSCATAPSRNVADTRGPTASELVREQLDETARELDGEDSAGFDQWFYGQRAYPGTKMPNGALSQAFDEALANNLPIDDGAANAPLSPAPLWLPFGPSTIPDGQTDDTAGTILAPISGRVSAIAIHPTNPNIVYVGGAQGGVWKTVNALSSNVRWTPLTDKQPSLAIGSIAIDPTDPQIVYAGTGEANGSCDSYYGIGLLRSADGGQTWTVLGGAVGGPFLNQAISKVIVDPSSAGSATATTLYVSTTVGATSSGTAQCQTAPGSGNGGLWRSTDSGQNWTRLDVPAGAVAPFHQIHDLALDPTNPDVLYAAVRSFPTAAAGGVWKSVNARAATPVFAKVATGFANTGTAAPAIRRITLGIGGAAAPGTLYAALSDTGSQLWGFYKTTDGGANWVHVDNGQNGVGNTAATTLTRTGGPVFTPNMVGHRIVFNNNVARTITAVTPPDVLTFNGAALALTGATWSVSSYPLYCNGQCFYDMTIGVDPANANVVVVGGNPRTYNLDTAPVCTTPDASGLCRRSVWRSTDGGATWRGISQGDGNSGGLHTDDHALVFDTSVSPSRLYDGNDGGIWVSNNRGDSWRTLNTDIAITQFQSIASHPTDPTIALGGTQDNGTNIRNVEGVPPPAWFHTDFGDGGQAAIDQGTPTRMFHTYFNQSNNFFGPAKSVTGGIDGPGFWAFVGGFASPGFENGMDMTDQVSFYAPFALHPAYTPNVVYFGSDTVYRAIDPQEQTAPNTPPASWKAVSPDLVNGFLSAFGIVPTLQAAMDIVYVGASTGQVSVALGGIDANSDCLVPATCPTWSTISAAPLPARFVTSIAIDPLDATGNTVYVGFSGFNSLTPTTPGHIFRTTNGRAGTGVTAWTDISGNLPDVPVNAIVVDPTTNPETLYVGTDIGVFRSEDSGVTWLYINNGHPNAAVFGLSRNAATGQILSATHGRGVFVLQPLADDLFKDGFEQP